MRSQPAPLLLAHGWGFDSGLWDAIRAALPDLRTACVERGYLGAAPAWPAVPAGCIAVGHSAGLPDLLADPPPGCAAIVSINGFTRFTAGRDFPAGVPRRLLDRMLIRLDADAAATLAEFRQRCGGDATRLPCIRPDRLRDGLVLLRDADRRSSGAGMGPPVLALAGTADRVVPPALTRGCFAEASIRWHDAPGHLLPLTAPDWCAAQLRALIRSLPDALPNARLPA